MATCLLIHGAWHGAWCWHRVIPLLQARGHRVLAPDLPGHGDDPAPATAQALGDYVRRVGTVLAAAGEEPVVLVGHSLAGLVISSAAEAWPDRLRRLVYITAFLPRDGDSLVRIAGADPGNPLNSASLRTADGKGTVVAPDRLREIFYADCPAEDFELAKARLGPEPYAALFETVHLTPERFGRVPRAYIHCTRDVAVPMFLQQQMVAATPCQSVASLATGHSPFFAAPEQLAAELDRLATPPPG